MFLTVDLNKEKLFRLKRNSLDSGYWRSPIISLSKDTEMPSVSSGSLRTAAMYNFYVTWTKIVEDSIINFWTPGH